MKALKGEDEKTKKIKKYQEDSYRPALDEGDFFIYY